MAEAFDPQNATLATLVACAQYVDSRGPANAAKKLIRHDGTDMPRAFLGTCPMEEGEAAQVHRARAFALWQSTAPHNQKKFFVEFGVVSAIEHTMFRQDQRNARMELVQGYFQQATDRGGRDAALIVNEISENEEASSAVRQLVTQGNVAMLEGVAGAVHSLKQAMAAPEVLQQLLRNYSADENPPRRAFSVARVS